MKHLSVVVGLTFLAVAAMPLACGGRTPHDPPGDGGGFGGTGAGDTDAGSGANSGAGGRGNASGAGGSATGGQGGGGSGSAGLGEGGPGGKAGAGLGGQGGTGPGGQGGTGPGGQGGTGPGGQGGTGPGGQGGTGLGGQGGAGSSGVDAGACRPYSAPAVCSQNPTGEVITQTMDAFRNAIAKRWFLCGMQSIFGQNQGDIGLEISPDGVWYKLYPGPEASAVRGAGFDQEGKWEIITVSSGPGDIQPYQLNFDIFGSGTIITHPAFASTPAAMRLNNNGVFVGNYVLDPSVPVGASRCPALVDPTRSGVCTPATEATIRPTCDDAAIKSAIVGRWSLCGGSMPGAPMHDGIELTTDGSFYFLLRDPQGSLVRGSSDAERGTASATPGVACQINTDLRTISGARFLSSARTHDTSPRQLWISTSPEWGNPERYTFVEP